MSKAQFTPGPWLVAEGTETMVITLTRIPAIAQAIGKEAQANARRIVACVNACQNIETEVLEKHALGVIAAENSQVEQQRDDLLAALEHIAVGRRYYVSDV